MNAPASPANALAALLQLRVELGQAAVLLGDDIPERNRTDSSGLPPAKPLAVVRPLDAAGVARTVQLCRAQQLPLVPQGGLSGLCGGARPGDGWIALSLERMVGVEDIDVMDCTMTVRAGTPLEAIQRAASDAGLYFALDLGARGSCTIGGNLSTNAGGNRVIRYGMARALVLGLEWVQPDGSIVTSLNRMMKNNAGYDLKQLLIGSEGTLGIITRAVLRLHPAAPCTMAALCALPDYASVLALLRAARTGLGPQLSAFEAMWSDYWQVVTERVGVRPPVAGQHPFYVLVEAQGTDEAQDAPRFARWLEQVAEGGGVQDAALAQSLADVQAFWALRDACAEFFRALGPNIAYDVALPVRDMDAFARQCKAALLEAIPGCQSIYYGHIGDGNLHLVAWLPGADAQPKQRADETVYRTVAQFGGSISAEHGIGTAKKPYLAQARSAQEIALMRTLKAALDPQGLLNPGKVIQG